MSPDIKQADLLLILGTSLQVAPVSMIPDMVNRHSCKRVLFNRELVGNLDIRGLKNKRNPKLQQDIFHKGDCDDTIRTLAEILVWYEELMVLNKRTRVQSKDNSKKDKKKDNGKKTTTTTEG